MNSMEVAVRTGDQVVTDLTEEVRRFCDGKGEGLVHVFAPHATVGLALVETGAGSDDDLVDTIHTLLPRATTATATTTVRRGTALTTSCRPSSARR